MKLKDLKEKLHKFEIVHPTHGATGSYLTVRSPRCNDYVFAAIAMSREEASEDAREQFRRNCELMAICVVAWDQDFFELECTQENVVAVLSDFENTWLREQIQAELDKSENFFPKP